MKYKNKNILGTWQSQYVIALIFILTLLFLFFEKGIGLLVVLFSLGLIVLFFYVSFNQLINISVYLMQKHTDFYNNNKGYRRYKGVTMINVPLFGFLSDIEKLRDNVILEIAYSYKTTTNSMLITFIVMFFFELLLVV